MWRTYQKQLKRDRLKRRALAITKTAAGFAATYAAVWLMLAFAAIAEG